MQTFNQTFAVATTWELNVSGTYFATLKCTNPVNIRLYKGGQLLGLGSINGLYAGLEVSNVVFDRVQIDVTGADAVQIGIGNGDARYIPQNAAVDVTASVPPRSAAFTNTQKAITVASAVLVAANISRKYLLIQNNDAAATIYLGFGAAAVTAANGIKIAPGASYEMNGAQSTQDVRVIGSAATSAVVVVEG